MRILYIWDADYPWDVRTEKICAALASAGHDVHIAARNRAGRTSRELLPEGTVHRMPPLRWRRLNDVSGFPAFMNPRWYSLLRRSLRASRAQLVIVRDLPLAPLALHVARTHDVPVLLDMAENYPAMLRKIRYSQRARPIDLIVRSPALAARVERHVLPRADRIMVVIEEAAEHARRMGAAPARLHVVSNTPPRSRATTPPSRRTIDVTYLGIMEIDRGLLDVIDAIALLRDRGVMVRARFVGNGRDMEVVRQRAASRGLGPAILELTGYVQGHERALELVAQSRIGLLPHHATEWAETTIPNKLFDYMAAGVPVLSSDNTPCARILQKTGAGRTFRSADVASLAHVMSQMLSNDELLAEQGNLGRVAVLERYNWEYDTAELFRAVDLTFRERQPVPAR